MRGHLRRRGPSWELRAYAGRDPSSSQPLYRTRTFRGTRDEAEAQLRQFVAEVSPFGRLLDSWLEEHPETAPEVRRGAEAYLSALRPLPPSQVAALVELMSKALAGK